MHELIVSLAAYWPEFITVAAIHLFAVMSPGPDFALITRNSYIYTRRSGVYTAFGIALGIIVHVSYSLVGIGLLISKSIYIFNVIKYLGACYLIYLGYKSITDKPPNLKGGGKDENLIDLDPISSMRTGFITNVLNPKALLFFLSVFTQVISPATPKALQILYGVEMSAVTFLWFAFLASMISHPTVKKQLTQFQPYIEKALGILLIALGIKVALSA